MPLKYDEIAKNFGQRLGTFQGTNMFGMSFADQFRNANQGLGYLRDIQDKGLVSSKDQGQVNSLMAGAKGMKGQAIAGGAIAGLTAGTQILGNAFQAGQIADTSQQQNEINDLSRVGTYGYNNFDEIARDYASTNFAGPDINYDDIRGMSTGEKIGNIGSSALSGAAAGMQIGGPWGAAIGGVIGAGASLAGVLSGNKKARTEEAFLNAKADMAASMANENLTAANERLLDRNNRKGAVNSVAKGGCIERKSPTIQEYANRVLAKPRRREMNCGGRITRMRREGGVTYRIRAK